VSGIAWKGRIGFVLTARQAIPCPDQTIVNSIQAMRVWAMPFTA
jgi:hypothetical protein